MIDERWRSKVDETVVLNEEAERTIFNIVTRRSLPDVILHDDESRTEHLMLDYSSELEPSM